MRILAVGPHPDDIEIGCAGNFLKYTKSGDDLYLMVMTMGGKGGETETRKAEQIRSAEILKARDLIWGGYEDTQLTPRMNDMVADIEKLLKKIKPDSFLSITVTTAIRITGRCARPLSPLHDT